MDKKIWEKKISLTAFKKKNELPEVPGVYFFLDVHDEILYIGKATSLRDRVKSYFIGDIVETRGPKIGLMLSDIHAIGYRQTDSVLEALLLESELIKSHQPEFNTAAKDDKSYNLVVITKEDFPRVLLVRGRDLDQGKLEVPIRHLYGPFPHGSDIRAALKIVRRLFPYRDKCMPLAEIPESKREKAKPCFSAQIGLCPGVCVGKMTKAEYQRNIRHIELFFAGKKKQLAATLEREMHEAAKKQHFERAQELRDSLFGIQHIRDIALVRQDRATEDRHRIEGYDVAHLKGEETVGVMTVVQKGRANTAEYRQFKLRAKHRGNDLSALQEILRRRFTHPEWPFPEFIVIDGGRTQVGAAEAVLADLGLSIPIVSVVKNIRHQPDRLLGVPALTERFQKEILLVNAEAHRFALSFHRKRRSRSFLQP